MQRIINEGQTFARRVVTDAEALEELAHEPYKCELVGLKGGAAERRPRAPASRSARAS